MRLARAAVKLRIANVRRFPSSNARNRTREYPSSALAVVQVGNSRLGLRTAIPAHKTPGIPLYSRQLRRFGERRMRHPATLTETGRSRISRANCPRWPGSTGAARFGPETARLGPASITGLTSLSGKIVSLACQLSAENDP